MFEGSNETDSAWRTTLCGAQDLCPRRSSPPYAACALAFLASDGVADVSSRGELITSACNAG
jgi:hypothetical protein